MSPKLRPYAKVSDAFLDQLKAYQTLEEGVNNIGIYIGEADVVKVVEKTPVNENDLVHYEALPPEVARHFPVLLGVHESETAYYIQMQRQRGEALSKKSKHLPYGEKLHLIEHAYQQVKAALHEILALGYLFIDLNSGNIFVDEHDALTGFVDVNQKYILRFRDAAHQYQREALERLFFEEAFSVLCQLEDTERAWLEALLQRGGSETFTLTHEEEQTLNVILNRTIENAILMWTHVSLWIDPLKGNALDVKFLSELTDNRLFMQACFPVAKEILSWASPFDKI